jgi:hypothetical protein
MKLSEIPSLSFQRFQVLAVTFSKAEFLLLRCRHKIISFYTNRKRSAILVSWAERSKVFHAGNEGRIPII